MVIPQQKISVLKSSDRATVQPEGALRDWFVSKRQALLIELASLEKLLKMSRRCKNCGHAQ
jgi:hypothetical protein